MYSLFGITCDVCSTLRIHAVLYSPGFNEVVLVLGVAVCVVADFDLLSAETTSTTHIIMISTDEMWTHITTTPQHNNIHDPQLVCIRTCTWNCIHAPHLPFSLPPPSHYMHLPLHTHHDVDAWLSIVTASTCCKKYNYLNCSGGCNHTPIILWVHGFRIILLRSRSLHGDWTR